MVDIQRMREGYRVEAEGFIAVSRSTIYKEITRNFKNYKKFESSVLVNLDGSKLIDALSNGSGIISISSTDIRLKRAFYYAQLAACCVVFQDLPVKMGAMEEKDVEPLLNMIFESNSLDLMGQVVSELDDRLHRSDALRMVTILRQLGLLRQVPGKIKQISFGAGPGNKDMHTIHSIPKVEIAQNRILLSTVHRPPKHIVLIDNDENVVPYYQQINEQNEGKVLAIAEGANEAIRKISNGKAGEEVEKRNFIVGIRVDHRMIPSVPEFFAALLPVMEERAEFMISVGAGHTLEEFSGRIELMQRLHDYLYKQGMKPMYLKLHGDGTAEDQRNSPAFGKSGYTTYEIIYCVLARNKISGEKE